MYKCRDVLNESCSPKIDRPLGKMDSSYQSHWYPMDPGSPDSTSPIPDEYAYRNKGDEADKEYISLERSAGLFSIPNESSFDLSSQNSQLYVSRHSEISRLALNHWSARIQPNRSRDNSQGVIRQPGLAVPQQESTITARSVASEQHHRIDPGSSESKPVTQTPVFKTPTPGRSVVQFPEYFGRLTDNPASTCTRPQYHRFSPIHNMTSSPESRSQSSDSSTKPSVKHLTCWWWYEKGQCRYSESECLYAHHDTGLVADAPRQVKPGGMCYPYSHISSPETSHNTYSYLKRSRPISASPTYAHTHIYNTCWQSIFKRAGYSGSEPW